MPKEQKIFISYAREDREIAESIYDKLRDAGFAPWMDIKDIRAGEMWERIISRAIEQADFILVCLSNHSVNKKGDIQREIKMALNYAERMLPGDIYLIPIRLDECSVPEPLNHLHTVDLYKPGEWEKLLSVLQVGVEQSNELIRVSKGISIERINEPQKCLFVAMPFSLEMEDIYFYGIQRSADITGFSCDRVDQDAFTGDVLKRIKDGIETSVAIVADLTGSNPNVYLEVGYAWGKQKPTILLVQNGHELRFDVRGQRCLNYSNIRNLEDILTSELETLKSKGVI